MDTLDRSAITLATLLPELALPPAVAMRAVTGVALDSRRINTGEVFVALQGGRVDGQKFISDAINRGAVAVLVESTLQQKAGSLHLEQDVPIIAVADLAARVSSIASKAYAEPSAELQVVGVTGTNGKSTTVSLLSQLYSQVAGHAATIGTLGVTVNGANSVDFGLTTPDAALCQQLLAQLRLDGVKLVGMEVSSHGLDQNRVAGVKFRAGIFTNITHDHLDYHGTLQNYAAAKQKLFEALGSGVAVINLDDPFAPQMLAAARPRAKVLSYSLLHFAADAYATDLHYSGEGVDFRLRTPWGEHWVPSPLLGEFNVYNLVAALTALSALGNDMQALLSAVPQLQSVPGRMQRMATPSDVMVVVDYAHTPDALAQAIAATRVHTSGRLWVVFGCGGDRDRGKRPVMASIAERFADRVIVTSDNPRTEDPAAILREICAGFHHSRYEREADRARAIHLAIMSAQPGDTVLIAGKGHETYQIIGEEKRPFSDVVEAERALQQRQLSSGGHAHAPD
jgi:UDP-N-acetylmuramoyl-L-alanyl-D-glutamate--2,6-diaminopimelate ligase